MFNPLSLNVTKCSGFFGGLVLRRNPRTMIYGWYIHCYLGLRTNKTGRRPFHPWWSRSRITRSSSDWPGNQTIFELETMINEFSIKCWYISNKGSFPKQTLRLPEGIVPQEIETTNYHYFRVLIFDRFRVCSNAIFYEADFLSNIPGLPASFCGG